MYRPTAQQSPWNTSSTAHSVRSCSSPPHHFTAKQSSVILSRSSASKKKEQKRKTKNKKRIIKHLVSLCSLWHYPYLVQFISVHFSILVLFSSFDIMFLVLPSGATFDGRRKPVLRLTLGNRCLGIGIHLNSCGRLYRKFKSWGNIKRNNDFGKCPNIALTANVIPE